MRLIYLALGLFMVALGVIGAFLPIMPTTIFLIIATYFFAKSSPRLETWVLDHPRFGPMVRDWREHGAISRKSKLLAGLGMLTGFAIFWAAARPGLVMWLVVLGFFLACAWFVLSRPEPE